MSDKIRTLSQAIRLGATFRPQGRINLFDGQKTCAIGAAMEAFGFELKYGGFSMNNEPTNAMKNRFPWFWSKQAKITSMNDIEQQSREQIASWLEAQGL